MPHLYRHFKENPKSLLARIYGVYSVNMKGQASVNLILMGNTLKFKAKDDIFRIYDIKGSRVSREVKTNCGKPSTTLKDINFFKNQSLEQEVNLLLKDRRQLCR